MSDSHTVVSEEGLGSRLGNSFKGIVIGAVLILVGIGVLFWNEGNYVKVKQSLEEAEGVAVSVADISQVNASYQGKVVHMSGDAITQDVLTDSQFGIKQQGIMLERVVSYYQWTEDSDTKTEKKLGGGETKTTTYTYKKEWVDSPIDSSKFNKPGYINKVALHDCADTSMHASNVTLGAYVLSKKQIARIGNVQAYVIPPSYSLPEALEDKAKLMGNLVYIHMPVAAPPTASTTATADATTTMNFNAASSTPSTAAPASTTSTSTPPAQAAPQVGDMKVTWMAIGPKEIISIVAQQQGNSFVPFIAKNKKEVSLLGMGVQSSAQLFANAHSSNSMMTWILRFAGFIAIGIGISMIMAPLAVLADIVPFIGNLVGAATTFAAFVLSFVISSVVISVAWIFYRPLIGGSILILAALGIYWLIKMRKQSKAAA